MARRRDTGMVSFDVSVYADETVEDDALREDPEKAPRPRLRERWRRASRRRRRAVVGTAGGVVLAVAAGAALSGPVTAYAEDERLRAAPGGVLSLDGDLAEAWSAEADGLAAVLPGGGLVLLDAGAAVAIDVVSGERIWSVDLGEDPQCGPRPMLSSGVDWTVGVEQVTCLHGEQDARTVTVLDADGDVVGQRDLDPGTYAGKYVRIAPAADGGLVVVEHDTGLPGEKGGYTSTDDAYAELSELEVPAATPTMRVEDALTGDRRFDVPVHKSATELRLAVNCYDVPNVVDGGPVVASLHHDVPSASPTTVTYQGCGAEAAATVDGTDLARGGAAEQLGSGYSWSGSTTLQPYPGGGFVVPRSGPALGSTLVSDDGATTLETADQLLAPRATDGTADGPVLAVRNYDTVVATDRTGTELWRRPVGGVDQVVSTADAVVTSAWGSIVGLDPADGTELWQVEPDSGNEWYPVSAVTDGDRLSTVVEQYTGSGEHSSSTLLTIDLATGETSRTSLADDGDDWPVAVDGHLVLLSIDAADSGLAVVGVRALVAP